DRVLEVGDLRGQRRLADAEPLRGAPEAARLRDRDEILELAKRDARFVARRRHDREKLSLLLGRLSSVISEHALTLLYHRYEQRAFAWSRSSPAPSVFEKTSSRSTGSFSRSSWAVSAPRRCSSRARIRGSIRASSRKRGPAIFSSFETPGTSCRRTRVTPAASPRRSSTRCPCSISGTSSSAATRIAVRSMAL